MNRLRTKRLRRLVAEGAARHDQQALAVLPDDRENGAGLDDDFEQLAAFVVEIEQIAGENQVAGRGDRQEFGQPFDDAENQGFQEKNRVHAVLPLLGGRILLSRRGARFEIGQPAQGLLARRPAHLGGRLQAGAAGRAPRLAENSATQVGIEVEARHARRLSQRSDGRRDAAGAAVRSAVHGFSFGYRRGAIFAHFRPVNRAPQATGPRAQVPLGCDNRARACHRTAQRLNLRLDHQRGERCARSATFSGSFLAAS